MKIIKSLAEGFNQSPCYQFTLINRNGIKIECLNLGCAITKIVTPDRKGQKENIVLSFAENKNYQQNSPYLGTVVGRMAGRIKDSEFSLNEQVIKVTENEGNNHLHGGAKGFSHVYWTDDIYETDEEVGVVFSYQCNDGEEGYPGNLSVKVTYALKNDNSFKISYEAMSDKDTVFSPTNHTYFNLSGNLKRDILNHQIQMPASHFLPLAEGLLPIMGKKGVAETTFDFREGRFLKDGIDSIHPQHVLVNGYDHFFPFDEANPEIILADEQSGRKVSISTDSQGLVLYTGNHLKNDLVLAEGKGSPYLGVCLETQSLPIGIGLEEKSFSYLKANSLYKTYTQYKFETYG